MGEIQGGASLSGRSQFLTKLLRYRIASFNVVPFTLRFRVLVEIFLDPPTFAEEPDLPDGHEQDEAPGKPPTVPRRRNSWGLIHEQRLTRKFTLHCRNDSLNILSENLLIPRWADRNIQHLRSSFKKLGDLLDGIFGTTVQCALNYSLCRWTPLVFHLLSNNFWIIIR
jgi:hypothetical protein